MRLLIPTLLTVLCIMHAQEVFACSQGQCFSYPTLLGKEKIYASTPTLVLIPHYCDHPGAYNVQLTDWAPQLWRLDTNEPVPFSMSSNDHYHLTPDELIEGVRYKLEMRPPDTLPEHDPWSVTFEAKHAPQLPAPDLMLDVETTPLKPVKITYNTNIDEADCGTETVTVYQRKVRPVFPPQLQQWRHLLLYRLTIDGEQFYQTYGDANVTLGKCSADKTYTYEASLPGTTLVWRSNPTVIGFDCSDKTPDHAGCAIASSRNRQSTPYVLLVVLCCLVRLKSTRRSKTQHAN